MCENIKSVCVKENLVTNKIYKFADNDTNYLIAVCVYRTNSEKTNIITIQAFSKLLSCRVV